MTLRLNNFWSDLGAIWLGPIDSTRLRIFEKSFAGTFLLYTFAWFLHAREWLTSSGLHLTALSKNWYQPDPFPLLTETAVPLFGTVLFAGSLCVISDFLRRPGLIICFGCAVYIQNVDPISAFALNKLYIVIFLILLCAAFSSDSRSCPNVQSAWPCRTIQATLLIQYFTSGLFKILHGNWLANADTLWTQAQGSYCTNFSAWLLRHAPTVFWPASMYFALGFELAAPILFVTPGIRRFGLACGVLFHLLIAVMMHQLIYFSLQILSIYLLFVNTEGWPRLVCRFICRFSLLNPAHVKKAD